MHRAGTRKKTERSAGRKTGAAFLRMARLQSTALKIVATTEYKVMALHNRCMTTATSDSAPVYLLSDARQKQRVRDILAQRSLGSYMNDTKWRELCLGMRALAFPPAYQSKSVFEDLPCPVDLPYAPGYVGDWACTPEASLGLHIEWLRIAPRYRQHRGRLIAPEILDCSKEVLALLSRLGLPVVEQGGFFVLLGHGSGAVTI